MVVSVFFDAGIDFNLTLSGLTSQVVNADRGKSEIHFEYVPVYDKIHTLTLSTSDPAVRNNPVLVTKIIFDHYWYVEEGKLAGCNYYDQAHIDWAKKFGVELDYNVKDNQTLFFTGKLVFSYIHPIYKNFE